MSSFQFQAGQKQLWACEIYGKRSKYCKQWGIQPETTKWQIPEKHYQPSPHCGFHILTMRDMQRPFEFFLSGPSGLSACSEPWLTMRMPSDGSRRARQSRRCLATKRRCMANQNPLIPVNHKSLSVWAKKWEWARNLDIGCKTLNDELFQDEK